MPRANRAKSLNSEDLPPRLRSADKKERLGCKVSGDWKLGGGVGLVPTLGSDISLANISEMIGVSFWAILFHP